MASRSVNRVILLGRTGKDAECKFLPSGTSVISFSLATNSRYKDKSGEFVEKVEWHNIQAFRMEKLAPYLTKGKEVYIEGRLQTRSYETKNDGRKSITEVIADEIILLGGSEKAQAGVTANADELDEAPF